MLDFAGNRSNQIRYLTDIISRIFEKNNHSTDYFNINEVQWRRFFRLDVSENDQININIGETNRKNSLLMLQRVLEDCPGLQEFIESCFNDESEYFCGDGLLQELSQYPVEDVNATYLSIKNAISEYFDEPVYPCRIGYGVLQVLGHEIDLENAAYNVAIAQWENTEPYVNENYNAKKLFMRLKDGFDLELQEEEESPFRLISTCLGLLLIFYLYFSFELSYIKETAGL